MEQDTDTHGTGGAQQLDAAIDELAAKASDIAARLHDGELPGDLRAALHRLIEAGDAVGSATVQATRFADQRDTTVEATGLPTGRWLGLYARRTGGDVGMLMAASQLLADMPQVRQLFAHGELSWGEIRSIVSEAKRLNYEELAELDQALAEADLEAMSAGRLVGEVAFLVDRIRPELAETDQRAAFNRRYAAYQTALDGSIFFHGELDAESAAPFTAAVELAARATDRDEADGYDTERSWIGAGRRRADGLVDICASYLAGNSAGQARPRLHAVVNLDDLADPDGDGRLHEHPWGQLVAEHLRGPVYLTRETIGRLAEHEDADIRLHFRDADQRTLGVSKPTRWISQHLNDALLVRDGGCRMPGCTIAHQRCDTDHTTPRRLGGQTVLAGLADKCRSHHPLCETDGAWTHQLAADGTMTFTDPDGNQFTTQPHTRRLLKPPDQPSDCHAEPDRAADTTGTDPPDTTGTDPPDPANANGSWPADIRPPGRNLPF